MFTDQFFAIAEFGHEITLWILVALSIFSLAFIIERYMTLSKVRRNSEKVSYQIRDVIQSHRLEDVNELNKDKETIEGRALAYGLRFAKENGSEGLEEIFNSFSSTEKAHLEKHLNFLATVGSNAPFIGLLGTVFGIMDAFRELATSQGDATAVMLGISKALVATAIGLLVAIPAIIAYNYFQKQVKATFASLQGVRDLCLAYAKLPRKGNS